jgi:hypothetical protein
VASQARSSWRGQRFRYGRVRGQRRPHRINADEFAQANVTYPLGVSNGSGNIGFPDPSASTDSASTGSASTGSARH